MKTRALFRPSLPIIAISCLPLLIGGCWACEVHRSHRRAAQALAANVLSIRGAEELAIGIRDLRAHLDRFLLTGDANHLKQIPHLHQELNHWLAKAQGAAVTAREQELIGSLVRCYDQLFADVHRLEKDPQPQQIQTVRSLIVQTGEVLAPAQDYLDYNEEEIQQSSEESQRTASRLIVGLLLLGVCGPLSGLLAGYTIARTLSRSIIRLSVPVSDAAGKLNEVVGPIHVAAELGLDELEAVLRRMAGEIGAVVERLQQSQREALRAEQLAALGQMAAGFAHELRNPLTAMKILVQSAAIRGGQGLTGRALTVLEEEVTRLETLTTTFLDFARPPRPEKRTFDAASVLEDTVDLVSGRAGQRDIRLVCDSPKAPFWVEADLGQFRQVVLNLLLNALEAVSDGGEVCVGLAMTGVPESRWVEIRVEDNGPGLPADLGEKIFAPFISTKPTGLGLGLSVCKRIAEAHDGDLIAANRAGGGAVFRLRLPRPRHLSGQQFLAI